MKSKTQLALAACILLSAATYAADTAKKPENGNIVVSKVFYSGSKGATSGNYLYGQYIELFNNSADEVDITGLYIGLIESESAAYAYTAEAVAADADLKSKLSGKVVLKQLFQIPDDKTYTVASGKTVVICNSAIDHTALAQTGHDLSKADFEVKTTNSKYTHNDDVPALKMVYTFNSSTDFMNLSPSGPCGIVLLKNNAKAVDLENKIFARGKETGSEYVIANLYYCVDAVDILANTSKGIDETTKRISGTTYDAGYTSTAASGTYNSETVYRKTAFINKEGRTVLYDTNNSTTDFQASATIQPRSYDAEMAGLSDTTIVIPESGYLAFTAAKPFFASKNVCLAYVYGNKNKADLTYNEFPGDSILLMGTDWIAIAQPGTYTLKQSEAQPMIKTRTTSQQWSTEDSKTLTGNQATRSIYKFYNTPGKVGFQRVPKTESGGYNVADFTDGNRLYLSLTPDIINAIYAANGAASAADLDFIPWHGTTPDAVAAAGISETFANTAADANLWFDLQGRRIAKPAKGLYINRGRKIMVK